MIQFGKRLWSRFLSFYIATSHRNNRSSMGKHDGLFELVKSLNQSEKRYFKIYASRHVKGEENQYMKIFSALDGLEVYEETALQQVFDKGHLKGNLSRVKSYLKDLILKSLVAYHANSSVRNRIKDTLRTVEVLYQKSLGNQCRKQLEKAEKMALENDELILLLEIVEWKGKILRITSFPEDSEGYYEQMQAEMIRLTEKIVNRFEYNGLSLRLHLFSMAKGHGRSEEDTRELTRFLSHPLLDNADQALSFDAKIRFHSLKAYIGISRFDYEFAYEHIVASIKLMEGRPSRIKEKPGVYFATLRNLSLVTRWLGNSDLTRHWIHYLKEVTPKWIGSKVKPDNVHEFFANLISAMDFYKDTGEAELGLRATEQFQEDFIRHKSKIRAPQLISYYFILGVLYFVEGDFHQAVKCFTEVINFPRISLREDLHCMTRLILLLSHLELGNVDLLEYLVKSAVRYLEKKKRLFKLEKALLRFISKDFLAHHGTSEWQNSLKAIRDELIEITQSPYEKKALKYFHFIAYFDSRIQGRTYKDCLLELDRSNA